MPDAPLPSGRSLTIDLDNMDDPILLNGLRTDNDKLLINGIPATAGRDAEGTPFVTAKMLQSVANAEVMIQTWPNLDQSNVYVTHEHFAYGQGRYTMDLTQPRSYMMDDIQLMLPAVKTADLLGTSFSMVGRNKDEALTLTVTKILTGNASPVGRSELLDDVLDEEAVIDLGKLQAGINNTRCGIGAHRMDDGMDHSRCTMCNDWLCDLSITHGVDKCYCHICSQPLRTDASHQYYGCGNCCTGRSRKDHAVCAFGGCSGYQCDGKFHGGRAVCGHCNAASGSHSRLPCGHLSCQFTQDEITDSHARLLCGHYFCQFTQDETEDSHVKLPCGHFSCRLAQGETEDSHVKLPCGHYRCRLAQGETAEDHARCPYETCGGYQCDGKVHEPLECGHCSQTAGNHTMLECGHFMCELEEGASLDNHARCPAADCTGYLCDGHTHTAE